MPARSHGSGSAPDGADPLSYTKFEDTPIVCPLFVNMLFVFIFMLFVFVLLMPFVLPRSFAVLSCGWIVVVPWKTVKRYTSPFFGLSSSLSRR